MAEAVPGTDDLVTIAIPTRNRLAYLKEAVASATAQTHGRIEVLIGQDPLPAGLDAAVAAWSRGAAAQDPRIRYVAHGRHLGLAGNWNALADLARGKFILIMGDDDRLLPDLVERLLHAGGQSGTSVVFSNHYLINEHGVRLHSESTAVTKEYRRDAIPPGDVPNPEVWVWHGVIPIGSALIRTEVVRRLRFKEDLNTPELELFLRLAQEGGRFVFLPEYLSEYRVHSGSATAAGLWVDRLALRLLGIAVSPSVEPHKREAMERIMSGAVSRSLLQGDSQTARKLLASTYYPEAQRHRIKGMMQRLCSALPPPSGRWIYLFSRRVVAVVRRLFARSTA